MENRKRSFLTARPRSPGGFSLIELLAALLIGTMVMVAAIGAYSTVRTSINAVGRRLDSVELPAEIIQQIAEDVDHVTSAADAKIAVKNKLDQGYRAAQLTISRYYYDIKNKRQVFDQIIWQANYDYDANGLILYRSHRGLTVEDALLDEEKDEWQRELFVPVAAGLTHFQIRIPKKDDKFEDSWKSDKLPASLAISISFTEPFQLENGIWQIWDEDLVSRTIAVDRTRNINFVYVEPELELPSQPDANLPELPGMDLGNLDSMLKELGLEQ